MKTKAGFPEKNLTFKKVEISKMGGVVFRICFNIKLLANNSYIPIPTKRVRQVSKRLINCTRCGKELAWIERNTVFWNKQLREGYIQAPFGMPSKSYFYLKLKCKDRKEFPDLIGKKICEACFLEIYEGNKPAFGKIVDNGKNNIRNPFKAMKDTEYEYCLSGLGLLAGEEIKLQYVCYRQALKVASTFLATQQQAELNKGLLVFTNRNMIFMQQDGFFSSNYSQALRVPLENIRGMVVGGMITKHIRMSIGTSGFSQEEHFTAFQENTGLAPIENIKKSIEQALKEAREQIRKDNDRIQIVLDFSSLKDVMVKGGLVMTTYKCPNCNGMVPIPEAGKVLLCEYCGTPIKPVDIFEKIKALIQ